MKKSHKIFSLNKFRKLIGNGFIYQKEDFSLLNSHVDLECPKTDKLLQLHDFRKNSEYAQGAVIETDRLLKSARQFKNI